MTKSFECKYCGDLVIWNTRYFKNKKDGIYNGNLKPTLNLDGTTHDCFYEESKTEDILPSSLELLNDVITILKRIESLLKISIFGDDTDSAK